MAGRGFVRCLARGALSIALFLVAGISAHLSLQEAAAQQAATGPAQIESYFTENERELERQLESYNKNNRIVINSQDRWRIDIQAWRYLGSTPNSAFVVISYEVGAKAWGPAVGQAAFELAWKDGELVFVGYQKNWVEQEAAQATAPLDADAPPLHSRDVVEGYFKSNEQAFAKRLGAYNQEHRYAIPGSAGWQVRNFSWKIDRLAGDRVFAEIYFVLKDFWETHATALFELQWQGGELQIVGHRKPTGKGAPRGGWLADGSEVGCVHNYYAAHPCLDTLRRWEDFAEFNGLSLDPESAQIFQAYKHNRTIEGDRMMARARGLPDPTGESVFDLQAEFDRLNLGQYQRGSDESEPCDLNPLGPRPCAEVVAAFQAFAQRHDLPLNANSATMFEAYAKGDFKQADVIYALAKGLAVPAYGYVPTGVAGEVAALRQAIERGSSGGDLAPCSDNPYRASGDGYKPCPGVLTLWRDFAKRYQLADNAENARIFENYASGRFRVGDQLLAQAKGVSLDQLLDAAGVPHGGLKIEVYPGWRRPGQRSRVGS